jgi:outer membrane protein OmpA-like peptidoglycan-associated protein
MNNNRLKPNVFRTIVILGFAIPLILSGSYLYTHFTSDAAVSSVDTSSDSQGTDIAAAKGAVDPSQESAPAASVEVNEMQDSSSTSDANEMQTGTAEADVNDTVESDSQPIDLPVDFKAAVKPYDDSQINLLETTDQTLYFSPQSFKISNDDKALLDSFVKIALMFPEEMISIEGHANGYPNFENSILEQSLSEDRMKAVKKYLEERGIATEVMLTFNCGSGQPASIDETTQQLNDRVEIYFTDFNARGIRDK